MASGPTGTKARLRGVSDCSNSCSSSASDSHAISKPRIADRPLVRKIQMNVDYFGCDVGQFPLPRVRPAPDGSLWSAPGRAFPVRRHAAWSLPIRYPLRERVYGQSGVNRRHAASVKAQTCLRTPRWGCRMRHTVLCPLSAYLLMCIVTICKHNPAARMSEAWSLCSMRLPSPNRRILSPRRTSENRCIVK